MNPNPLPRYSVPKEAIQDWLRFMQGPSSPPFAKGAQLDTEWTRLLRMLSLVLLLMGAIFTVFSVGIKLTGTAGDWTEFAKKSQYVFLTLVIAALLSVPYALVIAPLMRIRISLPQTFFAILLLGLPWVPLAALVWAFGETTSESDTLRGFFVSIFLLVIVIVPLLNFCKGVYIVSGCKRWQIALSILLPIIILLAVIIPPLV